MSSGIIVVKAKRDPEAEVWFVESSDLPGLNVEADTLEELERQLPLAITDLLREGNWDGGRRGGFEVPVELIAHSSSRVRVPA